MRKYSWYLKHILVILFLSQVYSCAPGNQSETKLEISHSFAMTSPHFGGGLIIAGVNNTTGKTFSKALADTKTVELKLDYGMWTIAAIGWDGGTNSTLNFSGQTHCGKTTVRIKSVNENINLSLNPTNCNLPFFNNGDSTLMESGVINPQFKPIKFFNTCGTFFKGPVTPSDNILAKIVGGGDTATITEYCESTAPELKSKVRSMRIFALEKGIFQNNYNRGFLSPCLKSDTGMLSKLNPGSASINPYVSGQELRLPLKNIPFGIAIYKDNSCTPEQQISELEFKNGLIDTYPRFFDHLVKSYDASSLKVILPSNERKRGISIFESIKPLFETYDAANFVFSKFPVTPTGSNVASSLGNFQHRFSSGRRAKIKISGESSCSLIANSVSPNVSFMSGQDPTCIIENSEVYITFQTDVNSYGSINLSMGSSSVDVNIESSGFEQARSDLQRIMINVIGHEKSFLYNLFFGASSSKTLENGYLSQMRTIFSAELMGSLFKPTSLSTTFSQACVNALGTKQMSFYDPAHLSMNTYKFVLTNTPISTPTGFICNPSDRNETACGTNVGSYGSFQKRLLFYDYKNSSLIPAVVMEFRCDQLMGKMEESSKYAFGPIRFDTHKIINWSTPSDLSQDVQRYEILEQLKKYALSGNAPVLKDIEYTMSRIFKTSDTTFEGMHYEFSSTKQDSGDYLEKMNNYRLDYDSSQKLRLAYNIHSSYEADMFNTFSLSLPYLNDLPATLSATIEGFLMTDSYPQSDVVSTSLNLGDPTNTFTGNNQKFNGTTEMKLNVFNPANDLFTTNFGTSFFTSP